MVAKLKALQCNQLAYPCQKIDSQVIDLKPFTKGSKLFDYLAQRFAG
jgi:hypothetical protein